MRVPQPSFEKLDITEIVGVYICIFGDGGSYGLINSLRVGVKVHGGGDSLLINVGGTTGVALLSLSGHLASASASRGPPRFAGGGPLLASGFGCACAPRRLNILV